MFKGTVDHMIKKQAKQTKEKAYSTDREFRRSESLVQSTEGRVLPLFCLLFDSRLCSKILKGSFHGKRPNAPAQPSQI